MRLQQGRRRGRLERMHAQLSSSRTEMLNNHFPHLLRYQSLTCQHVTSMLLREQRLKVQQVLQILPLRAVNNNVSNSILGLSVCGLRLPDRVTGLYEGKQYEVGR